MSSGLQKGSSQIWYYIRHFADYLLVPRFLYRLRLRHWQNAIPRDDEVERRINYYCRLNQPQSLKGGILAEELKYPFHKKTKRLTKYFFDLYEVIRYFDPKLRFRYLFGDITTVPPQPTFVKSRPISGDNANSVVLKLNKRRHFRFVNDSMSFAEKKNMIVMRVTWANMSPQRSRLISQYLNHPMCDVGKTRQEADDTQTDCVKPFMSIKEQLTYKFIACIEGGDVATSLKWVMSSNSLAVTPPLHYETWFMEGTLIPNYHYVEVKSDFSDLIEKMQYYINHPEEAEAIIAHAHEYLQQFRNKHHERALQVMVAEKYFKMTNQDPTP